ncbi:flagellar basal body-associated FliL family protein [Maricaulis sp.]|jgi:flagellar FliL protein|uniref:flagellar basal body-associated FliL family protein n=1 Tax=Maricaulis sp. TaxID=1486257 RepID=UPI002605B442|nr:flagellar basal body-associated FliL family protein [Maricaulis sp.]
MSDENDDIEDETEGEEKPKKSPIKLALFIGLPVLILLLAGVGGFLLFSGGGDDEAGHADAAQAGDGEHHEASAADTHGGEVFYYDLSEGEGAVETITTNIRSSDGRPVILQLEVSFESSNPQLGAVLEANVDSIMDQFIMFLRELREDDLYGSAGMHRVRLELLRRVNLAIEPAQVDAVLIQQFMIVD